jgi:DNA-binding CsgD family transcriptional regulator
MSRIAATVSSGAAVTERAEEILDQLGTLIPTQGALLSYVTPSTHERHALANDGYAQQMVDVLNGADFQAEVIEPFGLSRPGQPMRDRDLPVDPLSLRCVAEHFRPAGMVSGLLSALVTSDGRYVGFLDLAVNDEHHPSDEACAVVGYVGPALANVVDPLQSARWLASTLPGGCSAFGLLDGGRIVSLHGQPKDEFLDPGLCVSRTVDRMLDRGSRTAAFLWPRAGGGWFACRAFRCPDHLVVVVCGELDRPHHLTTRELEVLTYLVAGCSNADIAAQLWLSARTAKAHVEHILEKLEVPTRAAAAGRAIQEGLLLPPLDDEQPGFVRLMRHRDLA